MTGKLRALLGRIGYGALFVVVLPALLIAWARATSSIVALPAIRSVPAGVGLAIAGVALMLSGAVALMAYGKGLPMNAYPPTRYVSQGIYRLVPHPIYSGFTLACAGASLTVGSASGLWLVLPVVVLGCVALVEGHERHDLLRRFPGATSRDFFRLPAGDSGEPTASDRISVFLFVLGPWFVLYAAVRVIGVPRDPVVAYLSFEHGLPVIQAAEMFYASAYAFVLLTPLVAPRKCDLREFSVFALLSMVLTALVFLTVPSIAPPRPFASAGVLGWLLELERSLDAPSAAVPSVRVVLAILAARVFESRSPSLRWLWRGWAALIAGSCVATGMQAIVGVVAGVLAAFLVVNVERIWEWLRRCTELLANSWREWRLGPVRFINHGLYAGAGSALGITIAADLAGAGSIWFVLLVAFCILLASAAWAQWVEGSPSLLRPYGWYGGLLGGIAGCIAAGLLGADTWLLLAAFSVAAPWIQAAGRLRCLVQGCCHGSASPPRVGIRYTHPRSRVTRLSTLGGTPVHATPLYSILWNVAIAIVVGRLWSLRIEASLVAGVYLILMGLGRFVEESYRGEPQTPVKWGLRLYQWMAVASVFGGILVTMIRGTAAVPAPEWQSINLAGGVAFGLIATLALGADFPESNRRFARLA